MRNIDSLLQRASALEEQSSAMSRVIAQQGQTLDATCRVVEQTAAESRLSTRILRAMVSIPSMIWQSLRGAAASKEQIRRDVADPVRRLSSHSGAFQQRHGGDIEQGLDSLSCSLTRLREQSVAMHSELVEQNTRISNLLDETEATNEQIVRNTHTIHRIRRRS